MKRNKKNRAASKHHNGTIFLTLKGTGFLSSEHFRDDIEIPRENLRTALNGDEVSVKIIGRYSSGRYRGLIERIVRRKKDSFVGTVSVENGTNLVIPDDPRFYSKIKLDSGPINNVATGDKVYAKINNWTNQNEYPAGKIIKYLGRKGDNDTEMRSIALDKGFDWEFPPHVIAESSKIEKTVQITQKEIGGRRDFRDTTTFTIDPADAKDFDDAISFRNLGGGIYEIGVHIADVSFYVRPHSPIDTEARKRQFSVYLPDRTIPMLPPALSENLCSLKPKEEKLCQSAVFKMGKTGKIIEKWFGSTIIKSNHRFTYEEAQKSIENPKSFLHDELNVLHKISRIFYKNRISAGAIDFEKSELKVEVDSRGVPTNIYRKSRLDSSKLIEEFMLLANREVADFIYHGHKHHKPHGILIYRIHDAPDSEKITELGIFLKVLGYDLPINKKGSISSKDLNAILKKIEGKAEESLIKTAAIRTMAKAVYSTKNIGHYGLAFKNYTHFTSPIRRYPDLMIHRILSRHADGKRLSEREIHEYELLSRDATQREIEAAEAERESIKLKQVEFLSDKIGQTFDGVVSGVTEWGLYVEELLTGAEGMCRLSELGDDDYVLDQNNYRVVGKETGKKYSLGDKIKFAIKNIDTDRKSLNLTLLP